MNKVYQTNQILKFSFIVGAMLIVLASTIFTNRLAGKLSVEEQKKIEIWAEATRQLILADETTDMNFILKIIEGNTTIPVIITDENDSMIDYRNIKAPVKNSEDFFRTKIIQLKNKKPKLEIALKETNTKQYIYYDDSLLLKQLYYFPFIQFGVIVIFLLISFLAF